MAEQPLLDHAEEQPGSMPDYEALVIRYIRACRKEAEDARRSRLKRNEYNLDAYHGRQDWSHKLEGQSREFLPKLSLAVEQFVAVPHPSGRNRVWNDQDAVPRVRALLRALAPAIPWGSDV